MRHILFVTSRALGHVGRASQVADRLPSEVKVTFACVEGGAADLARGEQGYIPIPDIPRETHEFADAVEQIVADVQPDLICIDANPYFFALVRFPDLPTVYLTNWFLTPLSGDTETWQTDEVRSAPEINRRRAERGLSPVGDPKAMYLADDLVLCDPVGLIPADLPDRFTAAGPIVWEPDGKWSPPEGQRQLVASFGSTGTVRPSSDEITRLRRVLDCDVTVWVGQVPGGEPGPDDLQVNGVAISSVCEGAPLAVTQGGAGGTYGALMAGVPAAIEPTHRNHALLGDILQAAGIGLRLEELSRYDDDALAVEVVAMAERLRDFPLFVEDADPAAVAAEVVMRRLASGRAHTTIDLTSGPPSAPTLEPAGTVARAAIGPLEQWDDRSLITELRRLLAPGATVEAAGSSVASARRIIPGFEVVARRPIYRRRFARAPRLLRRLIGWIRPDAVKLVDLELRAAPVDEASFAAVEPPRRLIVHVGPHKTGTTAIQSYLARSGPSMRRLGLDYHRDAAMKTASAAALALLVVRPNLDLQLRRQYPYSILSGAQAEYRARVKRAMSRSSPTIMVSHEALSFVRTADEAKTLRELAGDRAVTIIAVRRERDEFLRSYRDQIAKQPDRDEPAYRSSVRYVGDDSWVRDFDAMIDVYAAEFGRDNVVIVDYEEAIRQYGSSVPAVLEACGVNPDRLPNGWAEFRNVSPRD